MSTSLSSQPQLTSRSITRLSTTQSYHPSSLRVSPSPGPRTRPDVAFQTSTRISRGVPRWRCDLRPEAGRGFGTPSDASRKKGGKEQPASNPASLREAASSLADGLKGTSIFLLGMMGSGKSTVGKILADSLGYYYFDSDEVVEQAAGGASVSQIFAENGEESFRDMETKVLSELSSLVRLVVSTGGGAVLRPTNWSYMQHGVTIFIDVPVSVLAQRVVDAGTQSRPLIAGQTKDQGTPDKEEQLQQAEARLCSIHSQRSGLYCNADLVVSLQRLSESKGLPCESVSPDDIALEVVLGISKMVAERKKKDQALRAKAG